MCFSKTYDNRDNWMLVFIEDQFTIVNIIN